MAKKIQILPKGQICLQNPLKFNQNSENLQNCQKLPNLSEIAKIA